MNCSQMTEDFMQRLPDSLDNSRDNIQSDDEDKINMFMQFDMNLNSLFDSTKTASGVSSKRANQYSQQAIEKFS